MIARNRHLQPEHAPAAAIRSPARSPSTRWPPGSGAATLVGYQDARPCFIGAGTLAEPEILTSGRMRAGRRRGPALRLRPDREPAARGRAAGRRRGRAALPRRLRRRRERRRRADRRSSAARAPSPARTAGRRVRARPHARQQPARRPGGTTLPYRFSPDGTELVITGTTPRPWAHVLANPLGHGAVLDTCGRDLLVRRQRAAERARPPATWTPCRRRSPPARCTSSISTPAGSTPRPSRRSAAPDARARDRLRPRLRDLQDAPRAARARADRVRPARPAGRDPPADDPQPRRRGQAVPGRALLRDGAGRAADRTPRAGCRCAPTPAAAPSTSATRATTSSMAGRSSRPRCGSSTRSMSASASWAGPSAMPACPTSSSTAPATSRPATTAAASPASSARSRCRPGARRGSPWCWARCWSSGRPRRWPSATPRWRPPSRRSPTPSASGPSAWATCGSRPTSPAFDRLVNDWLPYQLLTARLWGRCGPNQRGGAFGFRDQLQDVLPLLATRPDSRAARSCCTPRQQFLEGDVLQWWHPAPEGGTGLGARNNASDPHLWLPYLVTRYVEQTGDRGILAEPLPFLEGRPIPRGAEGINFVPRPSREVGSLDDHCRRAIAFTLSRMGPSGLPLIGSGDWNDGLSRRRRRRSRRERLAGLLPPRRADALCAAGWRRPRPRHYREVAAELARASRRHVARRPLPAARRRATAMRSRGSMR